MAELKTQKTKASVPAFLKAVEHPDRRKDCETVLKLMQQVTKEEPAIWGTSIVGFGTYHYKSERSRQEGDWFLMGFSPRKQNLTLYIMPGIGYFKDLVAKLGKCKTGGSCLYINKLADLDLKVLKELLTAAVREMKERIRNNPSNPFQQ